MLEGITLIMLLAHEQIELQTCAKEFAGREILPLASDLESCDQLKPSLVKSLWELGCFNLTVNEEFGGLGLGFVDQSLVLGELAYACLGVNQVVLSSILALNLLNSLGDQQQKKTFNQSFTDSLAGYDLNLSKTLDLNSLPVNITAVEKNGMVEISGTIDYLANAKVAKYFVVPARLDKTVKLYIIENNPVNIEVTRSYNTFGKRIHQVSGVQIKNVVIDSSCDLGTLDEKKIESFLTRSNLLYGISLKAALNRALDESVTYAQQRHTFGKPIKDHQGVTFMLSDMAKHVNISESILLNLASQIDCFKGDYVYSLNALSFVLQSIEAQALNAVQILGGYGYCKEYKVEKILRDIKTSVLELPRISEINTVIGQNYCQKNIL